MLRLALLLGLGLEWSSRADMTWLYAVQINAVIRTNPPQITLQWEPDPLGVDHYVIQRKLKEDTNWGSGIVLSGAATNFTDTNIVLGTCYEYQVTKDATLGYRGYGYIYAGIQGPLIENRGTAILIVAADTLALASELERLEQDLIGDGWFVIRHDVAPTDDTRTIQQSIRGDYQSAAQTVQAVFLFGHVPVLMSGDLDYDSHGARALPADGFYGDMAGEWNLEQDPTNRPSYFPATVQLMIGRVDFSNMPGLGANEPWPNETELLRRYLNKDHAWRHKLKTVPRRALVANRVGDFDGQAYAASGYRNFAPMVGSGNITEADVSDTGPPEQRWISLATNGAWLWSYACGGGQDSAISQLGTHPVYNDVWSSDIIGQDAQVVFSMFFGSHFGDWTRTDNIMRSVLAAPSLGLTACIVGLPHWFCHHLAMGEPIGYAARLTMNNTTLYQNQSNALPRAVFINLLGDPTLRMESVAPPASLSASVNQRGVSLKWQTSPEAVLGYHVYRSASPRGPFERLNDMLLTSLSYTDSVPFSSNLRTYMVRAVALQSNPSGTYLNPSEGTFVQVDAGMSTSASPATVRADLKPFGLQLTWKTSLNSSYHVEAKAALESDAWTNLSGRITATSSSSTFTDSNSPLFSTRLYRVMSE